MSFTRPCCLTPSRGRHCEGEIEGRRLRQARAVRRERQEVESPRKGEKVAEGLARCAHNPSHALASIIRTQTDASATARSPMSLEAKRADAHPLCERGRERPDRLTAFAIFA